MKRSIDLVMFDLDGTLADTGRDLADAVNFTRARFNLGLWPNLAVLAHVGRGVEHLLRHAIPEMRGDRSAEALRVFLERYENHLLDATVLYPNAREALEYFGGKRRALVSNKVQRLALAVLRGLGIEHCFDIVLGGDNALHKKPDPALLRQALARFELPAERALMIGDGDTDIQAGKRAGVLTCAVTYGLGQKDDLMAANPDFVIHHLSEISRYFY
jgi:HAD superfamily hydrolase (TIGR01549 family)